MYQEKSRYTLIKIIIACVITSVIFALIANKSFILFHSLLELMIVVAGLGLFMIAYITKNISDNDYFTFMGITYGTVALINIFHLFTYKGIDIITTDSNVPTQLWLAQRFFGAFALLLSFRYLNKKVKVKKLLIINFIIFVLIMLSIFTFNIFPDAFIEGEGLTRFKVYSEYITCVLFLVIAFLYYKNSRHKLLQDKANLLMISMVLKSIASLIFVLYINVYDSSNFSGHIVHFISYVFLFIALIKALIEDPYNNLFKGLSETLEATEKEKLQLVEELDRLKQMQIVQKGILATSPKGVIVAEGERIIYVSEPVEKILGLEKSGLLIGRYIQEVFDVTCHEMLKKSITTLFEGKSVEAELCYLRWGRNKLPVYVYAYTFIEGNRRYFSFVIEAIKEED
ncbi:MASE3 domain-containing protein [Alloiococcus sp. CFN-8]|uniref:MASE3 domain-containing protein n=1 Tax=Alloiococcus sp. CFN-8 TaxID=3416081 RepID=UPI003CF51712